MRDDSCPLLYYFARSIAILRSRGGLRRRGRPHGRRRSQRSEVPAGVRSGAPRPRRGRKPPVRRATSGRARRRRALVVGTGSEPRLMCRCAISSVRLDCAATHACGQRARAARQVRGFFFVNLFNFGPFPLVLLMEGRRPLADGRKHLPDTPDEHTLSKTAPKRGVLRVETLSSTQGRLMRHHRHVPRCHERGAARRCLAPRSYGAEWRQRPRTRRPRACRNRGTSRIGPPPSRELRGHEAAGRCAGLAKPEDPDCWRRLLFKLLRLLGGRA